MFQREVNRLFTGIIEEMGVVKAIHKGIKSARLDIQGRLVLEDVMLGDSIAVNGICLTVTHFTKNEFSVDVMAETMRKTNLNQLKNGSKVNLERALKVGSRLGGHMVSGHIDGTGTIKDTIKEENAIWVVISASQDILKYMIDKGSVAIDGVSLTAAYVDHSVFKVSIIPHTKDMTILLTKHIGDQVNIECDLIGKYVEKLLITNEKANTKQNIDMTFLSQYGFV